MQPGHIRRGDFNAQIEQSEVDLFLMRIIIANWPIMILSHGPLKLAIATSPADPRHARRLSTCVMQTSLIHFHKWRPFGMLACASNLARYIERLLLSLSKLRIGDFQAFL